MTGSQMCNECWKITTNPASVALASKPLGIWALFRFAMEHAGERAAWHEGVYACGAAFADIENLAPGS